MHRLIFFITLFFSITVKAQQAGDELPRLLDSIAPNLFSDYNKSMSLLEGIEKAIGSQRTVSKVEELNRTYLYKVSLNRFYFHPRICRQTLEEASALIEQNRTLQKTGISHVA